jgi:hypothetical protein
MKGIFRTNLSKTSALASSYITKQKHVPFSNKIKLLALKERIRPIKF